jgi:dihydroorotase-like cyclic amidohydrolase
MIALRAGRVITPLRTISPAHILVADGRIVALGRPSQVPIPADAEIIEVADRCSVPGFIDTYTHGRDGVYFGEDVVTTAELCRSIVRTGVTALLPTLSSLSPVPDTPAHLPTGPSRAQHADCAAIANSCACRGWGSRCHRISTGYLNVNYALSWKVDQFSDGVHGPSEVGKGDSLGFVTMFHRDDHFPFGVSFFKIP